MSKPNCTLRALRVLFFTLCSLFAFTGSNAQTTIASTYSAYYYWPSTGSGITFTINNTNASPILLTAVGYSPYSTSCTSAELWYSATSLTGGTGVISSSNPAWTLLQSVTITTPTWPTISNNLFSALTLIIPANTSYRFAVITNINVLFGGPPSTFTPTAYTTSGVSLEVGSSLFGDPASGGLLYSGYGYYGSITWDWACAAAPSGLNVTGITSTGGSASWGAVANSLGYEYKATTTPAAGPAAGTATNATSGPLTGLTPATNYYLQVRSKCPTGFFSGWVAHPFTTLPPCKPPIGFNVQNLKPTSADIHWDPWLSAQTYDIMVDQDPNDPTSTTGATNTASTSVIYGPGTFQENTLYYVHIRSNCGGGEQSGWSLDSFLTPIPCRAPDIKIDNVNVDEAVAYWAAVPTALHYEYAVTTSPTPPPVGTEYHYTSLHMSTLDDGRDYYIHVRSSCVSLGIPDISPWGTASFKTFPVSVRNVAGGKLGLAVYPNPVSDILTVEVSGSRSGAAYIVVSDMSGRQLLKQEANSAKNLVPMNSLPAGIYMVKYMDDVHSEVIRINKQ